MASYGLIGKQLSHSFSRDFFTRKFKEEGSRHTYENFELQAIEQLPNLLASRPDLRGLNVTIPYKQQVMPYLDQIDREAEAIGAVNTIRIGKNGRLSGYNTDHYGFARALSELLPLKAKNALVLGTGGASKAVRHVLENTGFTYRIVSRTPGKQHSLAYNDLTRTVINEHLLIVNCTPLGTWPDTESSPPIPYHMLGPDHLLFDLVYNPSTTTFMKLGHLQGARVCNGLKMLEYQALKAWKIWTKKP